MDPVEEQLENKMASWRETLAAERKKHESSKLLLERINKHKQARQQAEQEAAERAAKARQEVEAAAAADEELPLPPDDLTDDMVPGGLEEDPEPACSDESLFQPLQAPEPAPLDYSCCLLEGVAELQASKAAGREVLQVLLQQQLVLQVLQPSPQLLQLLFQVAVRTGSEWAAQQLMAHYQSLPNGEAPLWCPSFADFLTSLKQMGYLPPCAASQQAGEAAKGGRGKAGNGGMARPGAPTAAGAAGSREQGQPDGENDAQPAADQQQPAGGAEGAAGPCDPSSQPQSPQTLAERQQRQYWRATRCMQVLLRLLSCVCELELQHRTGSWLDCTRAGKAAGVELLMALLHLHLVPALCRVALREVSGALSSLVTAWSQAAPSVWDKHVVSEVASRIPSMGPSYLAALAAVRQLPTSTDKARGLQLACLLTLQASLAPAAGKGKAQGTLGVAAAAAAAVSTGDPGKMALDKLLEVARKPSQLITAMCLSVPSTAAAAAGPAADGGKAGSKRKAGQGTAAEGGARPDYFRIIALLECTHLVLWAMVYHQGSQAHHPQALQFKEYLLRLNSAVARNRSATATKMLALSSDMQNQLEFSAGVGH